MKALTRTPAATIRTIGKPGTDGTFSGSLCGDGAIGTYRSREYSPSRYAAGQRPAIHSGLRLRAQGLSRTASEVRAAARSVAAGLLPDVQPCAFGSDAAQGGGSRCGPEADSGTLRLLLERNAMGHP